MVTGIAENDPAGRAGPAGLFTESVGEELEPAKGVEPLT